jgi:mRNA degradation ribonuclease J1/J2
VLHTSDYKLDHTPVDGFKTDVGKLADLGNAGVDLMLGDSTNAERPGFTGSERLVGEAFRQIIPLRKGRVLIATFASNVHRMQQAIDVALEADRKVCVVGRSMRKNLNIARSLGYLSVPDDTLIRPNELDDYAPDKVLVLCTGSQGEPLSALTHRLQRPRVHPSRPRRHGDHLGQARARERVACPRHDQPARTRRRRDPAPGDRAGARLRARQLGGDPNRPLDRAPARRDAGARGVPDAGRAGADGR